MEKRGKTCEDCEQRMPDLDDSITGAVWLMNKLQFGFMDGFGGINIQGIVAGMELFEIPKKQRAHMMETILQIAKSYKGKDNAQQ